MTRLRFLAFALALTLIAPAAMADNNSAFLAFTFGPPDNPSLRTDQLQLYVCDEESCGNALRMPSNGAWRFTCSPAVPEGPNNPPQDGHCTSFGGGLPAYAYVALPVSSGKPIQSKVFPVPHQSTELVLKIDDESIEVYSK